jgi:WD40 repeat protein
LQSGKHIGNGWRDEASAVLSIALSPDGKKAASGIASGNRDGAVELWNIDTGKAIAKWMGHTGDVKYVCWNRDGGRVVGGCSNGSARVWNVESGKTGLSGVTAVILSPDTTMIATGGSSFEEYLKSWDAKTGELVTNLKGHTYRVTWLMTTGSHRRDS